ncbi:MAG: Verru Chthon cassette protein [Planctomycetaceae bacterium]|nr:Verru Chthon cassette protein [Planctomycetaceae bacterium]
MKTIHIRRVCPQNDRGGFTLVEMLIVAAILLIMTTLTVAVYSTTASADRIRSSARQVQSAIGGAKDRAIKAATVNSAVTRGVRLLLDANNPNIVTSLVFVGADTPWNQGHIQIGRSDNDGDGLLDPGPNGTVVSTIRGYKTGWKLLFDQGLLTYGARMRINTTWYWIDPTPLSAYSGVGVETMQLVPQSKYVDANQAKPVGYYLPANLYGPGDTLPGWPGFDDDGDGTVDNPSETLWPGTNDQSDINPLPPLMADPNTMENKNYEIVLTPSVLPSQEPMRLSAGVAIDLANSVLPGNFFAGPGTFTDHMDIMFTGQGNIAGDLASQGVIHLRLANVDDINLGLLPSDPQASTMLFCSIFPQTGFVGTFPVDVRAGGDPLYFAKIGGTAGR